MLLTWLQQTPGWVLPGASLDMNFAAGTYYGSGITTTRASTGYGQTVAGTLTNFLADTSRITDLGDTVEPAATNLALQSQAFNNAAWSTASVTVTANQGTAPDGTATADRAVYVGGLGSPDNKRVEQAITIAGGTASKAFANAFWLKSNTGSSQALRLKNTQGGVLDSFSAVIATTAWQRFMFAVTNAASAGNGSQTLGIVAAAADTAFDILAWQGQMENRASNTSDIVTTAAAATRQADVAVVSLNNVTRIVFTFSDATTQTISGVTPYSSYTIPTNLNKPVIARMTGYPV